MKFDLFNNIDLKRALSPAAAITDDTPQVTQILDMQGAHAAVLAINIGSVGDADATFAVLLEEGDAANLSDAAAVADTDMIGTEALAGFTFGDDNELRKLGYKGSKRYIRATITPTGNSGTPSGAFLSAIWIKGSLELAPADNPPA